MLTRSVIRNFATQGFHVVNDVAKQQFAVSMFGALATVDYSKTDNEITYIHTNVPQEFQGKGFGKQLAKYVFDYAKDDKLDVTCKCSFLAKYYYENRHKYENLKVIMDFEDI